MKKYRIKSSSPQHGKKLIAALKGVGYFYNGTESFVDFPYILVGFYYDIRKSKELICANASFADLDNFQEITLDAFLSLPEKVEITVLLNHVYRAIVTPDGFIVGKHTFPLSVIPKMMNAYNIINGQCNL